MIIHETAIIENCVEFEERGDVVVGEYCVIGKEPIVNNVMKKLIPQNSGKTQIGKGVSLSSHVTVYENTIIGRNTLIGDNTSVFYNVSIGENCLISRNVTINSDVFIGNGTRIMDNSHITGRTKIGSNVFISVGVLSANDDKFGIGGYSDEVKGFCIGDGAAIGVGVILMPGCVVGKGCIVAAGSVVKGELPEYTLCKGNPAKVVCPVPRYLRRKYE